MEAAQGVTMLDPCVVQNESSVSCPACADWPRAPKSTSGAEQPLSRRRAPPPALKCPGGCSATAQVVQSTGVIPTENGGLRPICGVKFRGESRARQGRYLCCCKDQPTNPRTNHPGTWVRRSQWQYYAFRLGPHWDLEVAILAKWGQILCTLLL